MTTLAPWDEVGTDVSAEGTLAEAMTKANVMFHVEVKQGYFISTGESGTIDHKAEGHFYIVRTDIDAVLGACKTKFSPLQNAEAFGFFTDFFEEGLCKLDTIGSFGLGQKVWILSKIENARFTVRNADDVSLYLILVNAHDGSTSVMIGVIPIRVICTNMFAVLGRGEFDIIKYKHTGDIAGKVKGVHEKIRGQIDQAAEFCERLHILTTKWPTPEELNNYFRAVFKVDKKTSSTKAENKVNRIKELFIQGKGNQAEGVRGTWYAAYNAVSEYLNFEAGRTQETRLSSLWFGINNDLNRKALDLAFRKATP